jgi:dTDP-4-amino-4,6-dideoxygalactose transaminase
MDKFKIVKYPPAKSKVYLRKSLIYYIKSYFTSKHLTEFENYFAEKEIIMANSWVNLLSVYLSVIKKTNSNCDEVIIPNHSCFEFTKSVLIAGLKPIYIDLKSNLDLNFEQLNLKISNKTLAIIGVSNVGVEIDFQKLKNVADLNNIFLIEDATYTFLGTNHLNNKFGNLGNIAVLNFSEGKLIPVGGGALVINKNLGKSIGEIKSLISPQNKRDDIIDFMNILIYKIGSSKIGYSLYSYLRYFSKVDLKRSFSMEPTRKENLINNDIKLITLSRFKLSIVLAISKQFKYDIKNRFLKHSFLRKNLNKKYKLYKYHNNQIVLKSPLLLTDINEEKIERLKSYGVSKLYSESSPLYTSNKSFPISSNLYKNLFTIPMHDDISYKQLNDIIKILNDFK